MRDYRQIPGGVRHDPQRFMGKTVTVPHFNRDTVEFASRGRDESNPGIKTLLPFLKKIREESDLENFQDLMVPSDACYWLHKAISIRYGDDRKCDLANFNTWCPIWGLGDWALQFVSTSNITICVT